MTNIALVEVSPDAQQLPATLDKIESAIAMAKRPDEINSVLALMDAAVAYAKRFYKDQQDVIKRATSLRLQAERRLGEILRDMPKHTGAKGTGSNQHEVRFQTGTTPPTLTQIGIDKKTSSRAQRLALLSDDKFAAVLSGEIAVAKAIATPKKKFKIPEVVDEPELPEEVPEEYANDDGAPSEQEIVDAEKAERDHMEYIKNLLANEDDPLTKALADIKMYRAEIEVLKWSRNEHQNKASELMRWVKSLQAKLKRLERAA